VSESAPHSQLLVVPVRLQRLGVHTELRGELVHKQEAADRLAVRPRLGCPVRQPASLLQHRAATQRDAEALRQRSCWIRLRSAALYAAPPHHTAHSLVNR